MSLKNNLKVPVLLIGFNRPDLTERVIEQIRLVKPKKLYFAVDGKRSDKDNEKVEAVKKMVKQIDWNCEIKTNFADKNYGCKYGPVRAMDWFFKNEEMGIILEDDVLADKSFFYFAQDLLEKYKDNKKVGSISGNNFQFGKKWGDGDYYFSRYSHSCGWATWRRAWNLYDIEISDYPKDVDIVLERYFDNLWDKFYWRLIFGQIKDGSLDSAWDYQWNWMMWKNQMLGIIPNNNLVKNIGFGRDDATHTKMKSKLENLSVSSVGFPIKYASIVKIELGADQFTQNQNYILWKEIVMWLVRKWSLVYSIIRG